MVGARTETSLRARSRSLVDFAPPPNPPFQLSGGQRRETASPRLLRAWGLVASYAAW